MRTLRIVMLAIAALACTGCAGILRDRYHYDERSEQYSRIDKHSTFPAVSRGSFEHVNLVELVDPEGLSARKYERAWKETDKSAEGVAWGVRYDLALAFFREFKTGDALGARLHRNSVQDRILGVSTSRCNVFKTYLRRQQSDVNFGLGLATTAAGVLGAVLPGVRASRNLAGAAGFLSGAQAEYNADYYSNLAAHVIVQGIELHQNRLLHQIISERQSRSITEYSMEAAIRDAIAFDGTCSTVVGLLEAADSIKEASNPGLATAIPAMTAVLAAKQIANEKDLVSLMQGGKLDQLLKRADFRAPPLIVSGLRPTESDGDTPERLAQAQSAYQRTMALIDQGAIRAGSDFEARLRKLSEENKKKTTLNETEVFSRRNQ